MAINKVNPYEVDKHVAEIYDQVETYSHDVEFILNLLSELKCQKILEPFCGTGRVLVSLAEAGYKVLGMDSSGEMLNRLQQKLQQLPSETQKRIELKKDDVTSCTWPKPFDVVLLGGNCLFELAHPDEQDTIIRKAVESLVPNGYLFVDNDNIESELPDSWCIIDAESKAFPSGICQDGTKLQEYSKAIWVDKKRKLWKAARRLEIVYANGDIQEKKWEIQKHPVGMNEVVEWLLKYDMEIISIYAGTENIREFVKGDGRATFWAKRKS
ncbi:MAG: class I SAM-dependent methyltransferase [bacterium]